MRATKGTNRHHRRTYETHLRNATTNRITNTRSLFNPPLPHPPAKTTERTRSLRLVLLLPRLPRRTSHRLRPAHRPRERAVRFQQPPKPTTMGSADHFFEQRHGPPQPLRQLSRRNDPAPFRSCPRVHPRPTPAVSPVAPRVPPRASQTARRVAKHVGHQTAGGSGSGGGGGGGVAGGCCFSVAGGRRVRRRAERWQWRCPLVAGRRRLAAGAEDVPSRKAGPPGSVCSYIAGRKTGWTGAKQAVRQTTTTSVFSYFVFSCFDI